MLVFSCFLFALILLKAIFAVVHDLAHGRGGLGSDLNEVKIALVGYTLSVGGGHDAELGSVGTYNTQFPVADLFVDLMFLLADE